MAANKASITIQYMQYEGSPFGVMLTNPCIIQLQLFKLKRSGPANHSVGTVQRQKSGTRERQDVCQSVLIKDLVALDYADCIQCRFMVISKHLQGKCVAEKHEQTLQDESWKTETETNWLYDNKDVFQYLLIKNKVALDV